MSSVEDQSGKNPITLPSHWGSLAGVDPEVWPFLWNRLITQRKEITNLERDIIDRFGLNERQARVAVRGELVRAASILQTHLLDGMSSRLSEVVKLDELYQEAWTRKDVKQCLEILDRIEKLRQTIQAMKNKGKKSGGSGQSQKNQKQKEAADRKADEEHRAKILQEEMDKRSKNQKENEEAERKRMEEEALKSQEPDLDKMSAEELRALASTKGLHPAKSVVAAPRSELGPRSDTKPKDTFTLNEANQLRDENNG